MFVTLLNGGSALICVCSYPALALPPEVSPSLARRVAAVAEVWAARVEDVRACRLAGYGAVHPDLARRLDPGVEELRRRLEALADAALRLPATGR